jgi:hypothetical protein
MKAYRDMGIVIHTFVTSTLHGGNWSASPSGLFTPHERNLIPITHEAANAPKPVSTFCRNLYTMLD